MLFSWFLGSCWEQGGCGVKLTTDLHLISGLTVYGAVLQPFIVLYGMHKDSFTINLTCVSVRIGNGSLEMFYLYRVDPIHVMYSNLHSFVPLEIFLQAESFWLSQYFIFCCKIIGIKVLNTPVYSNSQKLDAYLNQLAGKGNVLTVKLWNVLF